MAATKKVRELLWTASTVLGDTAPQFNRYEERELVIWLNDGQLAVTKYLPAASSRIVAMKLRAGTLQCIESIAAADWKDEFGYDGTYLGVGTLYGIQPLDFICNMGAAGTAPGDAIPEPVNRRHLDASRPNWHTRQGTKVRQVVYNPATPHYFHVDPGVPATPQVWIRLGLIAKPTPIAAGGAPGSELYLFSGNSATLLSIDDLHADDLVDYICARAFMKNTDAADAGKAVMHTQRFLGSLNLRVQALTGVNPNLTRLPFAPEPIGVAK